MRHGIVFLVNGAIFAVLIAIGCNNAQDPPVGVDQARDRPAAKKAIPETKPVPDKTEPVASVTPPVDEPAQDDGEDTSASAEEAGEEGAEESGDVELTETEGIMLESLVLAKGVEKRQPVDEGTSFSLEDTERVYAIMSVKNPEQTEGEVSVAWAPAGGGKERGEVTVSVGAQKTWRTWAFTRSINKVGQWEAIVRNSDGEIIGKAPFTVTP